MLYSKAVCPLVDLKRIFEVVVVAIVFSASAAPLGVQVPFFVLIIVCVFILIFDKTHRYFELSRYDVLVLVALLMHPLAVIINMALHSFWNWSELDYPSRYFYAVPIFLVLRKFLTLDFLTSLIWGVFGGLVVAGCLALFESLGTARVQSGYSNPISFGNVIAIQTVLLACAFFGMNLNKKALVWFLGSAIGALTVIATGTRGSLLVFFASLLPMFLLGNWRKNICVTLVGLVVVVFGLVLFNQSERFGSAIEGFRCFVLDGSICEGGVSIRLEMYRIAMTVIRENWLIGVGVGLAQQGVDQIIELGFAEAARGFRSFDHMHNEIISSAVEMGVLGALMIVLSYGLIGVCAFMIADRQEHSTFKTSFLKTLCLTFLAAWMISGLSQVNSGHSDIESYFAVMTAILLAFGSNMVGKKQLG